MSIKILADNIPKKWTMPRYWVTSHNPKKIEDTGNKLYLNYLDSVKAVDTNLFNTSIGIELCRDRRLQIEDEKATAKDLQSALSITDNFWRKEQKKN